MRVLAIRGRNLASLEGEFSIDFTEEPLASAGIFAISGPTGAGKSTLLDAMCLALFSRTPRTELAKEKHFYFLCEISKFFVKTAIKHSSISFNNAVILSQRLICCDI